MVSVAGDSLALIIGRAPVSLSAALAAGLKFLMLALDLGILWHHW
jgi:hypothetical protein